jgi:Phosphotransferase enzyme family
MTGSVGLGSIVSREAFATGPLASGSRFERGVLGDGRSVVLKHLPAGGDWLTRNTDGVGRARELWETGVLDRVSAQADHAVVAVEHEHDHDIVVMRDVGAHLVSARGHLPTRELEGLLAGLTRLHHDWERQGLPQLCSPAARYSIAAPQFHEHDTGPNPCPFRKVILRGWESFAEQAPADVVGALFAVLDDVGPLGEQLEDCAPATLLHGDFKLGNIGLRDGRLVLIDWGELTGTGPAEMDVAWFAMTGTNPPAGGGTWAIDAMPDEVFRAYEARAGRRLDPRALDLTCIGSLAQAGFILGAFMASAPDTASGARATQLLHWWVARVREAFDTWSPV